MTVRTMTTLTGKGIYNVICFVCEVYEINSKIFSQQTFYFRGVILDLNNIFSLGRHVVFEAVS